MPRRRATLSTYLIMLALVWGHAGHDANAIQRRYPRIFAAALADAMQLDDEQAQSFISTMEQEYVGILQQDKPSGFS